MGRRDDVFWAGFLGVEPEDWSTPGILFRSHAGLSGYMGFWCFRRNDRVVVSAPSRWVERLQVLLSGWDKDRLMDQASLAEALGGDFERSIGPAFQGCLEASGIAAREAPYVRGLLPGDGEAIDLFRLECGTDEWEIGGLAEAKLWRSACFEGQKITAMAGYRAWTEDAG
jgi:hypothetical protein